ncbi:MAG TPA: Hpt domain-containing protein, partial [Magnetospirillum sp.]|nr:Hpt domain-containing protein [Magnetospirillum sp.]
MSEDQAYDLSQFKATYFEECAELLANAEETLSRLQDGGGTVEDLNAVFRCVHSIKGGAGAFAFDDLVHFAHVFETTMDALRSGRAELSPHVAELLVRGNDVLGDFVRAAQEGVALPAEHGAEILGHLAAITSGNAVAAAAPAPAIAAAPAAAQSGFKTFSIVFTPTPAMLRTGNDPLLMLRELASLGDLEVKVDRSRLPSLTEIDPQASYLSWTCTLITDKGKASIAEVFEFVDGDTATITIEEVAGGEEGDGWGLFAALPETPAAASSGAVEGDGWGLFEPLPTAQPAAAA